MSTTTSQSHFDLQGLIAAIEADDPAAQVAAYTDDAVIESFNRDHGPGEPLVVRGREALTSLLNDVASRHLKHEVQRASADDRTGAVQVGCTYPDGLKVLSLSTFELTGGKIARETRIEVWDDTAAA